MLSLLNISAICYVSGVYICDFFGVGNAGEIAAVAVFFACILLLLYRRRRKYILVAVLFLCMGILGCSAAQNPKNNSFYPLEEKYVSVRGYVCDLPVENGDVFSYNIKTTDVEYLEKKYKPGQVIRVNTRELLRYGDNVEVRGFLKEFSEKKNSSDFDVKRYYKSRGIFYKMNAAEVFREDKTVMGYSLGYWFNLCRSKAADAIDRNFEGDTGAVLKAVILGNKSYFSEDFETMLLNTGIMKFFYPSYFHIYLISALVSILFSGLKKAYRDYILVFLLVIYAAFNSYSPVFVKNALVMGAALFAVKKWGFSHYPDIISTALLVICLLNPLYCFDVGIVMSAATGLLLYYFRDMLDSFLSFIPFGSLRRFVVFYIITTVGLLPLASYYFGGLSLYANLLTPLYLVVVFGLLVTVPAGLILEALFGSMFFTKGMISAFSWYFLQLPHLIEKLPFSHIMIKPVQTSVMIAFYCGLFVLYQIRMGDLKKTKTAAAAVISMGLLCSAAISYFSALGDLYITFVNVGQGDGAVASVRGGETVLIDGGGREEFSDYDAGKKVFYPYLADNGYFDIDKAIVSHYHSDHCPGIIAAMQNLNVREVLLPDYGKDNKYRQQIEQIAAQKGILLTYVKRGDVIKLKSGLEIHVLSPDEEQLSSGDENEASVVVRLEYFGFKCLFTGDIGEETEKKIAPDAGRCNVVKMAHHGSAKSSCAEFAQTVGADYAVVSLGENNVYGFPSDKAVYNYQRSGTKIIRTDVNGDITVRAKKSGMYKVCRGVGKRGA